MQKESKTASLLSFVITSFKNHKYITEAVDSVLAQDYPRIQLIFSDDGSGDFDTEALQSYLDEHAGDNIKDIQIYAQETNRGTVQNMEFCRQKCDGEYIMYMAADDALNSPDVLSSYVAEFERLGDDALVVCSKVAMCGEELNNIQSYEPSEEGIRFIRDLTPQQLYSRMCHTWTIPTTSCMYRRKVYDAVGPYDTDYFIMEDGPLFMKLARNGYRIYWMEDMIAARHRGGGISHGNTLNLSESYRKYRYDEIIFYEKEVLPFKEQILKQDIKPTEDKWNYLQRAYFETFVLPNMHGMELLRYNIKNFPDYLRGILRRTKGKTVGWAEDNGINKILRCIAGLALIGYILLLIIPWPLSHYALLNVQKVLMYVCFANFFFALTLLMLRIVRHLYLTIKYIFTGR